MEQIEGMTTVMKVDKSYMVRFYKNDIKSSCPLSSLFISFFFIVVKLNHTPPSTVMYVANILYDSVFQTLNSGTLSVREKFS